MNLEVPRASVVWTAGVACNWRVIQVRTTQPTSTRMAETWMCGMLLRCEPPVWRAIDTGSKRWPTQPTSTRKAETWRCRMLLRCEPPFLFGVQMTQDPSEDRFNLENSRAVVWNSSAGKMYLEVSHASAVWTAYLACRWCMIQDFYTFAEDGNWAILGVKNLWAIGWTECDAWWHRVGNQFLRCPIDHDVATAIVAPLTGAAPAPPPA